MPNPLSLLKTADISFSKQAFQGALNVVKLMSKANKPLVLVEGKRDKEIIGQFFVGQVYVIPAEGKGNLVKLFSRLDKSFVNILGIMDQDYGERISHDFRLFYYDYNNLETSVIHDDGVFDNPSLFNFGKEKFSKEELIDKRDEVLTKLRPVSIYRLLNFKMSPGVGVESVISDIKVCLSKTQREIVNSIKSAFLQKASLLGIDATICNTFVSRYLSEMRSNALDHCDITQGHDFVQLFLLEIDCHGESSFYAALKEAYKPTLFKKTRLYSSIKRFETLQMVTILAC